MGGELTANAKEQTLEDLNKLMAEIKCDLYDAFDQLQHFATSILGIHPAVCESGGDAEAKKTWLGEKIDLERLVLVKGKSLLRLIAEIRKKTGLGEMPLKSDSGR